MVDVEVGVEAEVLDVLGGVESEVAEAAEADPPPPPLWLGLGLGLA